MTPAQTPRNTPPEETMSDQSDTVYTREDPMRYAAILRRIADLIEQDERRMVDRRLVEADWCVGRETAPGRGLLDTWFGRLRVRLTLLTAEEAKSIRNAGDA